MPSLQYDRHALHCVLGPSQTIQTAPRCPLRGFVLTPHWTGCRLSFVVDLVEEHVDLGGSRFS